MESRWGTAATFIPSPPTILYQGGKTDPSRAFTYSSAPNSDDTILVPLSSTFDAASPPMRLVDSSSAPPYAFHTISTLNGTGTTWDLLAFGGDAGSSEPTQTHTNSVWRGRVDAEAGTVEWTHEPMDWGGQPIRRLYHSAAGPGADGKVYITGGLKGDGSGATFADVYAYDSTTARFETLPSLPEGLYGHSSVLLPNGTLVLVGGVSTSPVTGNPATASMTRVYSLDTAAQSAAWNEGDISGGEPAGRRGMAMVLSGDGSKAYLYGGGDAALNEAYSDGWELDMATSTWRPIDDGDGGPGARYGHTAVNVGGDQVVLFGGYFQGTPVAPTMFVWKAESGQWAPDYSPPAADAPPPLQSPSSTDTAAAASSTGSSAPSVSTNAAGKTVTPDKSATGGENAPSTSTTASSSPDNTPAAAGLSTPAMIALIVGAVAIAGVIAAGLLYRHRRKKRRAAMLGAAAWNGRRQGGDRPYGSREKGGEGLMDEDNGRDTGRGEMGEKSPMVGLGMGAIGATLASISSKLGRGRQEDDPYTVLHDRGASYGGPLRKSTRKVGDGIRLIGPRPSTSSDRYAPIRLGAGAGRVRSPLDSVKETRIDILHDEDSREFEREDWVMSGRAENGRWTSAGSILGHEHEESDPFSDGDDDESLIAPIRGGPVPTPHASRSELDPFDEYHHRRSSTYLASFDDLLALPVANTSGQGSFSRSQRSGVSSSVSDVEEGVVQHAHLASPTSPSYLSPAESEYKPIKRTDSFFKRMTGGGLGALLSRQPSQRGTMRILDIHDPTPAPALWPIDSRDEVSSPAEPNHPPTAFKGGLVPTGGHEKGPSLSSLHSARSMRDMVIVQRERTQSSEEEEGVIEAGTPDVELGEDEAMATGRGLSGGIPASESDVTVYAHARHGQTAVSETPSYLASLSAAGGETPGSIVFNGADFAPMLTTVPDAPPAAAPAAESRPYGARRLWTPPQIRAIANASPRSISDILHDHSTPGRSSEPPSGSFVPSPLLSHRRAVKDVVNSINKRGGGVPLAFASPASNYSPVTTAPPSPLVQKPGAARQKRSVTMYEAVKRERLLVVNPDKRKDMNRTNGS